MPVRCRGHVLRVVRPVGARDAAGSAHAETKIGVAVRFEGYEYLAESSESAASFPRVSALHPTVDPRRDSDGEEDRRLAHSSGRPVLG
jgi:hypothetical protein